MVDKRVKKIWETLSFLLEGEGGGRGPAPSGTPVGELGSDEGPIFVQMGR